MLCGINAFFLNLAKYGMLAATNGLVLVVHDGSCSGGSVVPKVTSKSRDGGNQNDDAELAPFLGCTDNGIYHCSPDSVMDGGLLVTRGGDEELILDVDIVLGFANDLAVGILNGMILQDAAGPVGAGSHKLRTNSTPIVEVLGAEGRDWMLDVVANGMLRPLDTHQILVFALAALKYNPVVTSISLVLVSLDKIPTEDKVLGNVINTGANYRHADIVPWHAPILGLAQFILLPVLDLLEIHDAVIVEILARPNLFGNTFWMHIGERMLTRIPTAKAEVQAANEGHGVVNNNELFVVCPVHGHVGGILENVVIGMSHDANVAVSGSSFGAQSIQGMLCMARVACQRGLDLFVHSYINLDASLGPSLQNLIQPKFLFVIWRASQEEFR